MKVKPIFDKIRYNTDNNTKPLRKLYDTPTVKQVTENIS